ncbi:hypothetical protein LCGC14_3131620, partial [marine sediment metagenome]
REYHKDSILLAALGSLGENIAKLLKDYRQVPSVEALEDKKMILDFSFTPNLDGLQGQYNVDWKLGDHVTAEYAGYTQDVRIQGISVSVAENESINIQLENTLI